MCRRLATATSSTPPRTLWRITRRSLLIGLSSSTYLPSPSPTGAAHFGHRQRDRLRRERGRVAIDESLADGGPAVHAHQLSGAFGGRFHQFRMDALAEAHTGLARQVERLHRPPHADEIEVCRFEE